METMTQYLKQAGDHQFWSNHDCGGFEIVATREVDRCSDCDGNCSVCDGKGRE